MGDTNDNNDNFDPLIDQSPSSPPTYSPFKSRAILPKTENAATSLFSDTGTTGNFAAVSSAIFINL